MPDNPAQSATVSSVTGRGIAMLKVEKRHAQSAVSLLNLAQPLRVAVGDPASIWFGPDCWLLVSDGQTGSSIAEECSNRLENMLCNVVDLSAALVIRRISGDGAKELLSSGCGIDFRESEFGVGSCCRTKFAQVAAIIVAVGHDEYEMYFDQSYTAYIDDWINDSMMIAARVNTAA